MLAAAELRFAMSGATSVNGSGGIAGMIRNVTSAKWNEGLTGGTSYFDTFPLGDTDGTELTSGCGYKSIRGAGTAFGGPG